jgi:mRNA interferase MazF
LGLNIGFEQDGKNDNFERPVLVLKKFNDSVLLILPLTKNNKQGRYYCSLEYGGSKYSIILSQVRLICSKRLLRRIRTLPRSEFDVVVDGFKKLL